MSLPFSPHAWWPWYVFTITCNERWNDGQQCLNMYYLLIHFVTRVCLIRTPIESWAPFPQKLNDYPTLRRLTFLLLAGRNLTSYRLTGRIFRGVINQHTPGSRLKKPPLLIGLTLVWAIGRKFREHLKEVKAHRVTVPEPFSVVHRCVEHISRS